MQILRHYPFSILTILAIWYLSFFTPPHTQLEEINNFDKLVHVCMYGGLSSIIWIEHLIRHKQIKKNTTNNWRYSVAHPDERNH